MLLKTQTAPRNSYTVWKLSANWLTIFLQDGHRVIIPKYYRKSISGKTMSRIVFLEKEIQITKKSEQEKSTKETIE